ncbi:MAG: NAD(+) synthase, partial [Planctomycetota bacterium]
RGVSLVLNPSASHFAFGKQAIRARLVREGAAAVGGAYVYANLLGNEACRAVYDGGTLFAAADTHGEGRLVAAGRRFSMADHTVTVVDVPLPDAAAESPEVAAADVTVDHPLGAPTAPIPDTLAGAGAALTSKHEEFSRVVPLALVDYLRKSGARGLVLSLSGGADSGAVATLVWLLAKLGLAELGAAGLAARLPRVEGLADAQDAGDAVGRLLTTVYQATENSSDTTRDAARKLATAVGAAHHEWDVDPIVAACRERIAAAVGRPLEWRTDDIALQNVQSRSRSPAVWMLANVLGALLLTTGNRSEASVGYATMDGDTSGGFAPLAGVDKAYLLEWLGWMERSGPQEIGPLPELAAINAQQPTAELRPLAAGQTDEADLMPYPVLDAIERSAVGALEPRDATLARLVDRFPEYDRGQLAAWVDRFWDLWRSSQWKRERIAPGLHLDTLSVDPKTWRRWPILSGPDAGGESKPGSA